MKTTNGQEKQTLSDWDTFAQVGTSQESSESGLEGPQTQYDTSAKPIQIVQSIRELQLLTQDKPGISPQDQQLMAERYQKQTQDTGPKTQDTGPKTQDTGPKTQDTGPKTQDTGKAFEQRFVVWGQEHKQGQVSEIIQTTEPGFGRDKLAPALTPAQSDAVVKGPAFQDMSPLQKVPGWEPQADEGKLGESGRDLQNQRNRLGSDVLERIKQQLDDLTGSIDARLQTKTEEARKDEGTKTDMVSSLPKTTVDWSKIVRFYETEKAQSSQAAESPEESLFEFPETPNPVRSEPFWQTGGSSVQTFKGANSGSSREKSSPLEELNMIPQADLSAMAKRIRGPHTSPESYSEAKFNQHIQTAEDYLKAGKYYSAAGSFTLASIYKLDDPLCLAGKGHALFAAGEYVSSALFLSRALEIAPEYARTKIDFTAMLGGENKLEDRIADIKEWLGRSGSGQLEFLLGYVYYRMGRLSQAKQAIDAASEKMSGSSAVDAVKKAIDDAIAGQ
jgi:tetratricopeptide (TPR) repeat protein